MRLRFRWSAPLKSTSSGGRSSLFLRFAGCLACALGPPEPGSAGEDGVSSLCGASEFMGWDRS